MFLRRDLATVLFGAILCSSSGPAFAQLKYTVESNLTVSGPSLTPILAGPTYVELPVDGLVGPMGATTKFSVDLISEGRLVTLHVSTEPSFFYTPISSASAKIFQRTLSLLSTRMNQYELGFRDVWVYPQYSTVDYYATSRTELGFSNRYFSTFSRAGTLHGGGFGDPCGAFYGGFSLLASYNRPTNSYSLLRTWTSGDCGSMTPMQVDVSSCVNGGVLDLLDHLLVHGEIHMLDSCTDSTNRDLLGPKRIVHCESSWW